MSVLNMRDYLEDKQGRGVTFDEIVERIKTEADFLASVGSALPALFAVAGGASSYTAVARSIGCDRRKAKSDIKKLNDLELVSQFSSNLEKPGVYQNGTGCTKMVQGVYQNGTAKKVHVYQNGTPNDADLGGHTIYNTLSLRDSVQPGAHALQSSGQVLGFDVREILSTWCATFQTIHDPIRTPTCLKLFDEYQAADIICGYDALVTEFKTNWNSNKKPNLGTLRTFIQAEVDRRKRKQSAATTSAQRPERQALDSRQTYLPPTEQDLERAAKLMDDLKAEKAESQRQLVKFGGSQ